ncbi:DMT family transporter [Eubacterium sp.]|uniref:DMT family transporter n=1 Tax=Eubacterium sp. TaxID=142586 RepID=UPI003F04A97B
MNVSVKSKKWLPVLALMCSVLWALAYPLIKLGYRELNIATDDLGSKVLFAGIRFLFAGALVLLITGAVNHTEKKISKSAWGWLLLFAIVNTSLHYLCSYIGLGYIPSARATIIDSMGSFLLIILSCIVFSDDRMGWNKVLGCVLGFSGIVIMNVEPGKFMLENISFLGDGMILLNAVFAAFGGVVGRIVSRKMDMTLATGISMAIGGGILCVVGLSIGVAQPWHMSAVGVTIIVALTLISAISFSIYNSLIANHPISTVAIYNAFIPVFGVGFSSLILGERFMIKYLAAGVLVALGIVAVNRKSKKT